MVYQFIQENHQEFGVRWLLRRFSLSPNAYYNFLKNRKNKYFKKKQSVCDEIRKIYHNTEGKVIESVLRNQVDKRLRYAIKKEVRVFDIDKLTKFTNILPDTCELKLFDEEIYEHSLQEQWSKDLCSQFSDCNDYSKRGLGVAVLYQGRLVSGASSYTVYIGGIEIEIDTKPEF